MRKNDLEKFLSDGVGWSMTFVTGCKVKLLYDYTGSPLLHSHDLSLLDSSSAGFFLSLSNDLKFDVV